MYRMPDGGRLIVPRVLARTTLITRTVVTLPEGHALDEGHDAEGGEEADRDRMGLSDEQQSFWKAFLDILELDDPEQQIPKPARQGHIGFTLPAPGGSAWITAYRDIHRQMVGVFLSSRQGTVGERAVQTIADDWEIVKGELGGTAELIDRDNQQSIRDRRVFGSLKQPEVRESLRLARGTDEYFRECIASARAIGGCR